MALDSRCRQNRLHSGRVAPSRQTPTVELPCESEHAHGWILRVARTFTILLLRPGPGFARCPDVVPHGIVLRFLATLRFPLWLALVAAIAWVHWRLGQWGAPGAKPVHSVLEPALTQVLSVWLLLMVPIGMPLLYFLGGLLAHISIALTGGATRSIGASMRATGYALGPALLAVAIVDFPLYFGRLEGMVLLAATGAIGALFLLLAGVALGRTHQMSLVRGLLVAVPAAVLLVGATLARGMLEVATFPGLEVPPEGYFLP